MSAAVEACVAPLNLDELGIYDQDTAAESAFARVLLIGPAKAGKTTCLALGAPKPLILNCDGANATKGAANQGAKFAALDVTNRVTWKKACATATKLAGEGHFRTIIVDTVSLLCDNLLDEISQELSGWDVWTELNNVVIRGVKQLLRAEAHVFIVSHMQPDHDKAAGIMPAIGGKLKVRLPALVDDWVQLHVDADRNARTFLLGPQKSWTHSGRNVKRTCEIEATVPALFAELGIRP